MSKRPQNDSYYEGQGDESAPSQKTYPHTTAQSDPYYQQQAAHQYQYGSGSDYYQQQPHHQNYGYNNNYNSNYNSSYNNSYHQHQDPEVQAYLENYGTTAAGAGNSSSSASRQVAASSSSISSSSSGKKHFYRSGGTEIWEDSTLAEWDQDDYRIFCGDLGVDVTDDVLFKAFSAYPSMQRARVVFDKRSGRTKGYGFVSFKDPEDYRKAMREMNGKYVGSRPVKLRKSTWKDRDLSSRTMKKIKKGVIKPY